MDFEESYKRLTKAIVAEHEAVFERLDMRQLDAFMDEIIRAKHIFVYGTGREGISMRGFAMRLAHLGKSVYWLTPLWVCMRGICSFSVTAGEMWGFTEELWSRHPKRVRDWHL